MKYRCVKKLQLMNFDDDGSFLQNEHFAVEVGSIWEEVKTPYRFVAADESYRMTDSDGRWIEIHGESLENISFR